jgi:membrane-associated phospholipid phosphatase
MNQFERFFHFMMKPVMVMVGMVFVLLSYIFIDRPLAMIAHDMQFQARFPWLLWVTNLGIGMLYIVLIALLALILRFVIRNKPWERRIWFLWLCVVVPNMACLALKMLLGRARPDLLFSENLYGFYGLQKNAAFWSFPSGHTTTIMALMLGLSALFPRYLLGFILFGSLVACSRILLLQHYLSDVLAATYLAIIGAGVVYYWLSDSLLKEKN